MNLISPGEQWKLVWSDFVDIRTSPNTRIVTQFKTLLLARTAWVASDVVSGLVSAAGTVFSRIQEPVDIVASTAASLWSSLQGYFAVLSSIPPAKWTSFTGTLATAIEPTLLRVGLEGGDAATSALRQTAYSWAVFAKLPTAVSAMLTLFAQGPAMVMKFCLKCSLSIHRQAQLHSI